MLANLVNLDSVEVMTMHDTCASRAGSLGFVNKGMWVW
jgi:hypothetical protein